MSNTKNDQIQVAAQNSIKKTIDSRKVNLIDRIKERLGGKELTKNTIDLILEAQTSVLTMKEKVAILTKHCLDSEKLSKEETKTVVAETMGVSVRTAERYFPLEYKDPKYTSNEIKERADAKTQRLQKLISRGDEEQEQEEEETDSTKLPEPIDQTPETKLKKLQEKFQTTDQETKDLREVLKKLKSKWTDEHPITIEGRTFKVKVTVYPDKRVTELDYNEKEIFRVLKAKRQ